MNSTRNSEAGRHTVRAFWPPWIAGLALGLVLLLTFLMTGHGLGATGFTTRLAAWLGLTLATSAAEQNAYIGPMLKSGNPMPSWITWEVLGVALGALVAAYSAGRWRVQIAGNQGGQTIKRLALALLGGILAGLGARIAAGCTSGVGLSGGAVLSVGAFVFLGTFFAAGLIVTRLGRLLTGGNS
jgi:uncharacterized membrane protein YedE/YeeE